MKVVNNNQELRLAYEILSILSKNADRVDDPEKLAKCIIDTKQAVRRYTHREVEYDRRIIRDDGIDGYLSLERLPKGISSLEEAIDFFDRFMTCDYRPSAYDCTGQPITNWFKVFPRNGGYYAYHSVRFDV
jgi:hypothetical protein